MPIQSSFDASDSGSTPPSEYEHSPRHDGDDEKNKAYHEGAKMAEESLEEAFEIDSSDKSDQD